MENVRDIAPTGVRIPTDLKEWLKEQARLEGRSLNTEIVRGLQEMRRRAEAGQGAARQ